MSTLAGRLRALRARVGGYREQTGWEQGTGVPVETRERITPPGAWNRRILAELGFAARLSGASGAWDSVIDKALGVLEPAVERQGALPAEVCAEAEGLLGPELAAAAKEYTVICAAHAHIDMNWMWSWQETVQSALATFRTMLALMEDYPEFTFSQSQASCYRLVEEYDGELMEAIKRRISEGRWEVTASSWVETDKNMPCTESLVRHISLTKRYLHDVWGVVPGSLTIDFSPDTFGHSANIPEIDAAGGVKYLYHCRGLREQRVLYRWRGPSGAELLCHCEPYWYNRGIQDNIALGAVDLAAATGGLKTSLIVYGVGDHGGGPTRRDIARIREMAEWPVYPALSFGTFREYFARAEEVREQAPLLDREINFIFTGCYTTQSRIKLGNRRSEAALLDAEALNGVSAAITGKSYPLETLTQAWRRVLFNHFHDIITGSCVRDTRDYAMAGFAEAQAVAGTCREKGALALAELIHTADIPGAPGSGPEGAAGAPQDRAAGAGAGFGLTSFRGVPSPERGAGVERIYHVFNPVPHARREAVTIVLWDWEYDLSRLEVTDHAGGKLPFQVLDREPQVYWDHAYVRVLAEVEVPALGYATVVLREGEEGPGSFPWYCPFPRDEAVHGPVVLENEFLRAEFDAATGALLSLRDQKTGKEALRAGRAGGLTLSWAEKRTNNAWNIGRYLDGGVPPVTTKLVPRTGGALRNGFTLEQEVLRSRITTEVSLDRGARALAYRFTVAWNEAAEDYPRVPVLRFVLPLAGGPEFYETDIPGGARRAAGEDRDVPALQYAAAVSGAEALALVTDCTYGYRCGGGGDELSATLINTAGSPDPYSERGEHEIRLWVLREAVSGAGGPSLFSSLSSSSAKVLSEAAGDLCHEMNVVSGLRRAGTLPPVKEFFKLEGATTVMSSLSLIADKTLLVRLYETGGARDRVTLTAPLPIWSACLVDLEGKPVETLTAQGAAVTVDVPPGRILGVKISF